jgi:hypothetical protein
MVTKIEGYQLLKWIHYSYLNLKYAKDLPEGFKRFKKENVEWNEYQSNDTFYVVIPGTLDWEDIKDDFKFCQVIDEHLLDHRIRIHEGFFNQAKVIYYALIPRLTVLKDFGIRRVVFCGHSLGGAIAQILGLFFQSTEYDVKVFTAGSPRVFNSYGVKYYNKIVENSYRVVNGNDLVTILPFRWFGYKHTKGKIQIGFNNLFYKIMNFFKWSKKSWFDHNPRYYVKNWNKKFNKI